MNKKCKTPCLCETCLTARHKELNRLSKAYGGCTKCYGKGYSTRIYDEIGYEDFGGEGFVDKEKKEYKPCSCDRGRQIAVILKCKLTKKTK